MDRRDFHVTVKGLYFDREHRVLMLRESTGVWDLPGGRLEHGESFHEALRRECREEMGIECEVLDAEPCWSWPALGGDGRWKVVLCFRIRLPHLNFTPSEECVGLDFVGADAFDRVGVTPQIRPLKAYLA